MKRRKYHIVKTAEAVAGELPRITYLCGDIGRWVDAGAEVALRQTGLCLKCESIAKKGN